MVTIVCKWCGKEVEDKSRNTKEFCSEHCTRHFRYQNNLKYREYQLEYGRKYRNRPENKEHTKEYGKRYYKIQRKTMKEKIFNHYGKKCVCCGESQPEFLVMDHINGGGNKHLKEIGRANFYKWLIKNNFPKEFQTLCFNCNFAKSHLGCCPHQKKEVA